MKDMIRKVATCSVAGLLASSMALAHGWVAPQPPPPPVAQLQAGTGGGSGPTDRSTESAKGGPRGGVVGGTGVVATGPQSSPGGVVRGGTPARRRPAQEAWVAAEKLAWTPAFLPQTGREGYAKTTLDVAEALRRPATEGGLVRESKPTVVFLYDAGNKSHVEALRALDTDGRLRTASAFFNLFRIDAVVDAREAPAEPVIAVYTAAGEPVGETRGDKRLGRVYELMETAFAKQGGDLGAEAAKIDAAVKTRAHAEWRLRTVEAGVVCPDCGELRHDLLEEIATLRARVRAAVEQTSRRA
jgi:hypothetical protein